MPGPKFPITGETIHHTRYTLDGRCFCAPRPALENTAGYLYAHFCMLHGQVPHAEVLMPDGRAGLLTDCTARRSDFFHDYHLGLAKQWGGKVLGRTGGIWDKAEPGDKPCMEPVDVVDTLMEIWTLPLKHNLVDKLQDYPGFMILPDHWGKTMLFFRPPDAPAHWPLITIMVPQPPPQYRHWPLEEVKAFFNAEIEKAEKEHRKRRRAEGIKALGPGKCLNIPTHLTIDREHHTPRGWHARDPRLADAARAEHAEKWKSYDVGRVGLQKGRTDHVFPAGTFKLTRQFAIEVEPERADPLTVIDAVVPAPAAPTDPDTTRPTGEPARRPEHELDGRTLATHRSACCNPTRRKTNPTGHNDGVIRAEKPRSRPVDHTTQFTQ